MIFRSHFSKVSDVVSARLYIYELSGMVLTHIKLRWMSNIIALLSGDVQNSGISPLMFLIYINQLIYLLEAEQFSIKVKRCTYKLSMILCDFSVHYSSACCFYSSQMGF